MINHWLITGDTHSLNRDRLEQIDQTKYPPNETALIILGDAGFNYYLDSSDRRGKKKSSELGYIVYCVRGNHEARPSEVPGMKLVRDEEVDGMVWVEEEFPRIRYFCDWGHYTINGHKTLVIGGAYSVDKYYRLQRGWRWFKNEQLEPFEMDACYRNAIDYQFDLILSHTCPLSLRPTDLFLRGIDQSIVDNSMEVWLENIRAKVRHNVWLWGHYHADRIEAPHCEVFYFEIEDLEDIFARWENYDKTVELDWWLPLSPQFYNHKENENEEE